MSTLSLLQTYASGAFFVDSDASAVCLSVPENAWHKRNHGQCGFQANRLHLLDIAATKCFDHLYPTQTSVSLILTGKRFGETSGIAPISFDYETDATATGASQRAYEINDNVWTMTNPHSHWHERSCFMAIDWPNRKLRPKWSTTSMNTSLDPWDQLWSDISCRTLAEWVWKLNRN